MLNSRRYFLAALAALSPMILENATLFGQAPPKRVPFPTPPPSAETQNPAESQSKRNSQTGNRTVLLQNEKDFREGVARLYQLTSELKQEVDKTVTTEVFSLQMYKRTEEIAKLAKQLQAKAKG